MNGINEWLMNIQNIVDDIDRCIKSGKDEKLTLGRLRSRSDIRNIMFQESSARYRELSSEII
jgi:hypothetical protein